MNSKTYTKTSFDYCYPINKRQAKNELDNLDRIINDLKHEAKKKKQFFKL